uniref:Probable DNA polymerase n=1 Tax=Cantharellus cibarius TaxID=36066 RepID=A0A2U3TMM3_CANCI|nr:hypothetical protein [Cantharellus cibarius]
MNKIKVNSWQESIHVVNNKILTRFSLEKAFNQFILELKPLVTEPEVKIIVQFKVVLESGLIRTISRMQTITNNDYKILLDIFKEYWSIKTEEYHLVAIQKVIFTYKIVHSKFPSRLSPVVKPKPSFSFKGYDIPNTMDLTQWGEYKFSPNYHSAIIKKYKSKAYYSVVLKDREQLVELKINDKILLSFIDKMSNNNDLSSFTRELHEHTYIFREGNLILKQKNIKNIKYLTKVIGASHISYKFVAMDLETRAINGIITPYALSIYDGKDKISFYLSDYPTSDEMLIAAISSLLRKKYDQYKVYIHNFSHFDSVFMIKVLSNMNLNILPLIRDGRIIDLKLSWKKYSIYMRDSYLLLPSSLAKLTNNFQVESKGIFPYQFVNNSNIPLDYRGSVPNKEFYPDITNEQYDSIINTTSTWDLRTETIKYCEQDVVTLYQVIAKFSEQIFILFRIDVLKYPTLPLLAFGIYRNNFMGDAKIPLIHGEMYDFLVQGYTGGSVDVYKPSGNNIYRYDVNSLYPFVMKTSPMPIGNISYFEGDITQINPQSFGIFEVEVTAPQNLHIPILQLRMHTQKGIHTVAPIGDWKGVYFSEEIKNAKIHGYTFKVIRGYTFDKGFIFKDYVDFLYKLKVNSDKTSPDYTIAKLLLNSLYGRMGMSPYKEHHVLVSNKEALNIISKFEVSNVIDFKNGKELVSFFDHSGKDNLNISVAISLAVTAMAKVHTSQFKTMKDITLFYSDTDSIDIDKPLPIKFIGNELGKMKLEHIFDETVFLAPKVYVGRTIT